MGGKSETRWFESRELGWGGGGVQNQTKTNNGKKTQNIIV